MIQVYKKNELFIIENTVTDVIYPNLTREEALVLLKKFDRDEPEDRCDFAIKEDNISFEHASLDDKDKTVVDLEAKLAESEKKAYSRGHSQRDIANEIKLNALREDVANKEKRIVELKQQLEKSEKSKESYRLQNEQHHLQLLQFYSRLGVEAFGADIHEKALETLMIMKERLAITEKALELACEEIIGSCEYCSYNTMPECPIEADCLDEKINYFKAKAKEMLENEKRI